MTTTTLRDDIRTRLHDRLTQQLGAATVGLWLDAASLDYLADDNALRLTVPSKFAADRLRRGGLLDAVRDAAADVIGHAVEVRVLIDAAAVSSAAASSGASVWGGAPNADAAPQTAPADHGHAPPPRRPTARGTDQPGDQPGPRPRRPRAKRDAHGLPAPRGGHPYATTGLRHRLEDFVAGSCNELALAAATRLADADPEDQDVCGVPLFIHGGCGLGKTHLLQGVCRRWIERRAGQGNAKPRVLYTTGEQFTNRYIDHAQRGALDTFRQAMRNVDLLAIDDVHFIAGKTKTQTEFLHCFDAIELCGAPVVLASDQHPRLIKQFPEALSSRCLRGLVVEVTPPDTATRRKLCAALAVRKGMVLQPAALDALAAEVGPTVREIEGVLIQLHALATLTADRATRSPLGVSVGMPLVDKLLSHQRQACPPKPATVPGILRAVADAFALTPRQVSGNGRQRPVVLARAVTVHLARDLTPMSYPEIAEAMQRPNHSSAITAHKRVKQQLEEDIAVQLPTRDEPVRLSELIHDLKHAVRRGG